jgi:transcription elongation GreA/GreB family factor
VTDFADRPISPFRNFVTAEGLRAIETALGRFEAAHKAALDKGDKLAAAAALREVRYWRARHASAEIVERKPEGGEALFGTTVTLRRDDGREQTFRIVGEDEAKSGAGHDFVCIALRPRRPGSWRARNGRDRRRNGRDPQHQILRPLARCTRPALAQPIPPERNRPLER